MNVAYQGEPGAYSDIAVKHMLGSGIETMPCETFEDAFNAVSSGKADAALMPIENSIDGTITQTYDLLATSWLKINGEHYERIEHCLLAKKGTNLKDITVVYSHPTALRQCNSYLREHKLKSVAHYDTAGAAKMVADSKESVAAIASEEAAKLYGLEIVAKNIEDNPHNYTRFVLVEKQMRVADKNCKTSIIFRTKHVPKALYNALGVFARWDINLLKLESRPIWGEPWSYQFYLDFDGKHEEALEELKNYATHVILLGIYPKEGQ